MNKLILQEMNSTQIVYLYIPEDRGESGVIIYDRNTQNAEVVTRASDDTTGSYAHKARKKVIEFISKKNLPMEAVQAWY
jgi:hypothetical protein